MYRMTLVVDEVMGSYVVEARLQAHDWETASWEDVASSSRTIVTELKDVDDAFRTLLIAIRMWAEDAVSDSHK